MKKISRYLVREFLPLFFVALGFIAFLLSLGILFQAVDLLVANLASGTVILSYWFFLILYLLPYAIILAALIAVTITFGRFSQDREYLALKSLGVPIRQSVVPLLLLGLLISLVNLYWVSFLQPQGLYRERTVRRQAGGLTISERLFRPGSLITAFPDTIIFLPRTRQQARVTLHQHGDDAIRSISARKMTLVRRDGQAALLFEDGVTHTYDPKTPENYQKLTFKTYLFPLPQPQKERDPPTPRINERPMGELVRAATPEAKAEAQRRVAFAFAPLFFMLIGIPLGISLPRSIWGIIAACGLVLTYYLAISGLEVIVNFRPYLAWFYFLPGLAIMVVGLHLLKN